MSPISAPRIEVPSALYEVTKYLAEHGIRGWLVGQTLHDLVLARPVRSWELSCPANASTIAELFERAVLIDAQSMRFSLPSRAGPIDIAPFRNGSRVEADLARRGFSVLALALDPLEMRWLDPHAGLQDLSARRLRCVGSARDRLREAPWRALQAGRLIACEGYEADDECLAATRALPAAALRTLPPLRLFGEIRAILLGPQARRGLEFLRASGVEAALAPRVRPEAPALVDSLPRDLALRLAAWLRGANAGRVLARLRSGHALASHVQRLLAHHPIDRTLAHPRPGSRQRWLRRLSQSDREALFELRRCELAWLERHARLRPSEAASARERLSELARALERQSRESAAPGPVLGGRDIMRLLGIGPGPQVGAALRRLAAHVRAHPDENDPERLSALLRSWAAPPAPCD